MYTPGEDNTIILFKDPRASTRMIISSWLSGAGNLHIPFEGRILACATLEEFGDIYSRESERTRSILAIINFAERCPQEEDGLEEMLKIRNIIGDKPCIVMTDCVNRAHMRQMLEGGVRGIIPSDTNPVLFANAVMLVKAGGIYVPPFFFEDLVTVTARSLAGKNECSEVSGLTKRENQVFELLQKGKANKFIAYQIGIHESTVKVHVRNIMRKLHATNRTHAVFLVNNGSRKPV